MNQVRIPLHCRPRKTHDGDAAFAIEKSLVASNDERALALNFICKRQLFGHCYRELLPDYFDAMSVDSGVFIAPFVPSAAVLPRMNFPGDIDLLIIPYDGDELVLSMTLAVELKVIRATFTKQGKSPNEFGFSQGAALLAHGFPYAAVGHLIVSDMSPESHWRQMLKVIVLDPDSGRVSTPEDILVDMMPSDLLTRSHGRMLANCSEQRLGTFTAYLSGNGTWMPEGRRASANAAADPATLEGVRRYYELNYNQFLDTPRR
ncbi:hypothetical protein ACSFBF_20805 [Variovorax sp. ZT5P49]|uniref:hypothetical protein n=1 Tax=Variovorax sp. ZT5P49 TaxID=3443733 RepID=UPI003F459BF2